MGANQTVTKYGETYFSPTLRSSVELERNIYGLTFPLGKQMTKGGFLKKGSSKPLVVDAVHQLLRTEKGERLMLPQFGCDLRKYIFQPLDESTFESIKYEILEAVHKYIVGAHVTQLRVTPYGDAGPGGGNSLQIILTLQLDEDELAIFDAKVIIK